MLVSLLGARDLAPFLEKHQTALFAEEKRLIRRVIQLLRVAYVTRAPWLAPSSPRPSVFNVPNGNAWPVLMDLIAAHLSLFDKHDAIVLLALVDDWSRGVSWQAPYPAGSEAAAMIAHWLLNKFSVYGFEKQRAQVLRIIAMIPLAESKRFQALFSRQASTSREDRGSRELQKMILEGMDGLPVARDFPDLTVRVAKQYLLLSEPEFKKLPWWRRLPRPLAEP